MKATLDHIDQTAHNIKTFWFRPERPIHQVAGEFTELYLPHDNPDERGVKHWFTVSSSPTDELMSITTKFPPEGQRMSTFKQTLLKLPIGVEVNLAEPMGDFVLPISTNLPILFVAGGIGITPVHSMVKYLHDKHEQRDITLLYTAHDSSELAFLDLFRDYKMDFEPMVQNPDPNWQGEVGTLTSERVIKAIKSPDTLVYLSGPEAMIEALTNDLKTHGVDKRNIVTDFFPGYSQF